MFTRTVHSRVFPSTVAVTVVIPLATAVTLPLASTVAMEVFFTLQVGVPTALFTLRGQLSPTPVRVKSLPPDTLKESVPPVGLALGDADGEGDADGLALGERASPSVLRTMQLCAYPPAIVALMVATPWERPVTLPLWSTETISGLLLLQVMEPVVPAGANATAKVKLGDWALRVMSCRRLPALLVRLKPVAVCPAGTVVGAVGWGSPVVPGEGEAEGGVVSVGAGVAVSVTAGELGGVGVDWPWSRMGFTMIKTM